MRRHRSGSAAPVHLPSARPKQEPLLRIGAAEEFSGGPDASSIFP
ncbi:MAG: hypothetical protein JWP48_4273 [Actinoallomurus sp.]|jgi:hypothetical protein|nr:hypothetical protein [Actinoallomurus sp.]